MCKPSCCPGEKHSSSGTAVAAIAALVVISAAARPLIHAAELVIQAALITIGAAVILTAVALVTIALIRVRRAAARLGLGQLGTSHTAVAPYPPARTWAQAVIADRIHALGPADRVHALGPVSMGSGKSAAVRRKVAEALDRGDLIWVVDGKNPGGWS